MNQPKISKKNIGLFLIILVIFIGFILVIFGPAIFDRGTPHVTVTKINESGKPSGNIIHLSDDDFKQFPSLAPVIRDNTQQGVTFANGTRVDYTVKLSWDERTRFKYSTYVYYEYNGKYYQFSAVAIP
jgi:hypothetical protein